MPLQGKGKESLAQRSLPLRPPPETWGTPPSPIPPLGTKGRAAALPFGNPSWGWEAAAEKEAGGCPLCSLMNAMPPNAGTQLLEESASAQPAEGLRICIVVRGGGPLVLGELAHEGPTHPQEPFLLTMNGRFLFGKTKRKWGFNPVRHSRTFPNQSGALGVSKRKWGGAFCAAKPRHPVPHGGTLLSPKEIPPHILGLR